MAIGIFDSGLGGLTVFETVNKSLPDLPLVYFADSANAPYGVRDADDIYDLTKSAVSHLWNKGCDLVILACNTASATALRRIQENNIPNGKRVLGVFVPLIEALTERNWGDNSAPRQVAVKNVALFATPATIASRAFQRELAFRAVGVDVEGQSCDGVVDAIEKGDLILAEQLVRSYVAALLRRMPHPEVAILGCTHYPLLQKVFKDVLGLNVKVFSQAHLVAESLTDYLTRHPSMYGAGKETKFLTTGNAQRAAYSATQILQREIKFEAL